ncbi:MAG: DNA polymerase IV [Planctomycetes bacterium]|nr:DNA polymerase IV [Planctomycetota bacterium]
MPHRQLGILHVDMDAFYASVEQRDRPESRGLPVIVGGLDGRGVVCAASYEARPFGVRSAMPISQARRLCPQAVYLPVRMSHYAEVSRQIRDIMFSFTPLVEPLSLDEAFLDVGGCRKLFGTAPEIARQIRARIKSEVGLNASVGAAPNKFLAKLASDLCKPDGLMVVPEDQIEAILTPLPVERIWGVGAKSAARLHALGIRTIGQLSGWSEHSLVEHFGEMGSHFWRLARGLDDRSVEPDREAKSISSETTFAQDIADPQALQAVLLGLVDHVAGRLRQEGLHARTIDLKVRSSDFRTKTLSKSIEPTHATEAIWRTAALLLERSLTLDLLPVRLLGVGAGNLVRDAVIQGDLFDGGQRERQNAVDRAVDAIRAQFGTRAIERGGLRERRS